MLTLRMSGIKKVLDGVTTPKRSCASRWPTDGRRRARAPHDAARASELKVNLHQLLKAMIEKGASDMHITTGSPPLLRIDGIHRPAEAAAAGAGREQAALLLGPQRGAAIQFEKTNELDLSFGVKGLSRFRANIYVQRGAVAGAFRTIPFKILTFEELGLPADGRRAREEAERARPRHGPTGSGQVDDARGDHRQDQHRAALPHHDDRGPDRVSAPAQALDREPARGRERHRGFKTALKYVLRQDPDVVLVGEMRDLETIEAALTISETGHLVFATLHTNSAVSTINRIIDVFPPHQQTQIRAKLSFVLQGVVSQQLLPGECSRPGRVMALEVLYPQRGHPEPDPRGQDPPDLLQMQVGQDKFGMQTLNQSALLALPAPAHLAGGGDEARSVEPERAAA
jgi:twitching motility protein PilT